ncbi:protein FAR-RED IMPAIRED RESPONSE 1-like [Juglans regia]|uniref:Protein FAR-RED IMPAIRED RESPONSE 1-like n=1 Tax=Juglans regia TaxID=51240 RepID=A0A6P9F1A8_JUGRE|nr:protein FAR-RED IMPAIRED RESPONSE 1-like [Juglans regia]
MRSLLCNESEELEEELDVGVEVGIDEEKNAKKFKVEVVDAPMYGMIFKDENVVIAYYKRCAKQVRVGIRMKKNFSILVVEVGGFENLEFTEKDYSNFIDKARHLRLGKGGVMALLDYFDRMHDMDNHFYASMDFDDEERLRNVLWANARSRASYLYFGDVVTFDTTYLTNRYEMSFAPFVGIHHHGQCILLDARLISSEDTQ